MNDIQVRRMTQGRVAILEMDQTRKSTNVVDEGLLRELEARAVEALSDPAVDAIVLSSGKRSFGAGADVGWLPELAMRPDAEEFLHWVHGLMATLISSEKPIVAAVQGYAFGGALELALSSDAIVAAENTRLGLPEVTLGLLPGGGGTQLLTRFVPLAVAAEMLTSGRTLDASEAVEIGLVRDVVAPEDLRSEAIKLATELASGGDHRRIPGDIVGEELTVLRTALTESRAGLSRAADTILEVLGAGVQGGLDEGLAAERTGFLNLLRSPEARAAIHLFLLEKRVSATETSTRDLESLAVVGGGQMGAGIAATAVTRGLRATVLDINQESVNRAHTYLEKVLARHGHDQDGARARWTGSTDWAGFEDADLVVEAVFENPELKIDVLTRLSGCVADDAVVATNTSAISVERLAGAIASPERFLGMHFFSPVERMPLVELIPHSGTSAETMIRATAAGRRLGKVTVTVGDAPGFFTSRVYARWLIEGVRLVLDGVDPMTVDAAAKRAGFPVGPLQAHDEATLELVLAASIGQVAEKVMSGRLEVDVVRTALEKLVASGAGGRRYGRGFYKYDAETGKRIGVNEEVMGLLDVSSTAALESEVVEQRLLLAFVTECLLCWDDGTLCHPDDGDLASVLGIGFPRALGGPFHWADETGLARVAAMCEDLGTVAFPCSERLLTLADAGRQMSAEQRRAKPFEGVTEGLAD